MAKVKGTILIDFVKTIKADKSGTYDPFLTDEDRKIIDERLLASAWYPYDTFKHCMQAAVHILAKDNMDTVHQWGRMYGEAIVTGVYKGMIKEGRPMESLQKYNSSVRNLFDFGELRVEPKGDNQATMKIRGFDPDFEPQFHMIAGWIERSLELCGAKDIECRFEEKSWEGGDETSLALSWKEA